MLAEYPQEIEDESKKLQRDVADRKGRAADNSCSVV
jgi:hypothetical protein